MKIYINKESCSRVIENLKSRNYTGKLSTTHSIYFEKPILSRKKRGFYGFKAIAATVLSFGLLLVKERIRDLWQRVFSGKKVIEVEYPKDLETHVSALFKSAINKNCANPPSQVGEPAPQNVSPITSEESPPNEKPPSQVGEPAPQNVSPITSEESPPNEKPPSQVGEPVPQNVSPITSEEPPPNEKPPSQVGEPAPQNVSPVTSEESPPNEKPPIYSSNEVPLDSSPSPLNNSASPHTTFEVPSSPSPSPSSSPATSQETSPTKPLSTTPKEVQTQPSEIEAILKKAEITSQKLIFDGGNSNSIGVPKPLQNKEILSSLLSKALIKSKERKEGESFLTLRITNAGINDEAAQQIAQFIREIKGQMLEIDLKNNLIGNTGAKAIAEAIAENPITKSKLILSDNKIGCDAIIGFVPLYKNLNRLSLDKNLIGNEGASKLVQGVLNYEGTLPLQTIDLGNNGITDCFIDELIKIISKKSPKPDPKKNRVTLHFICDTKSRNQNQFEAESISLKDEISKKTPFKLEFGNKKIDEKQLDKEKIKERRKALEDKKNKR